MLRRKPMVPGYRPLIVIGYKYNARKVIYFIVTYNAGNTKTGIPYLYKYPEKFTNVAISLLLVSLLCQKKSAVNEVESHKKSIQCDLALEKWWVTKCGWMRLYTTVATGMTITNVWKLFSYGVKRDHYEK